VRDYNISGEERLKKEESAGPNPAEREMTFLYLSFSDTLAD
jgi:hypothetical protein